VKTVVATLRGKVGVDTEFIKISHEFMIDTFFVDKVTSFAMSPGDLVSVFPVDIIPTSISQSGERNL